MLQPDVSPRRSTASNRVLAVRGTEAFVRPDRLAAEEPMEIRAQGPGQTAASVAVTMRTPGHDFELAVGFLFTEGLIGGADVASVRYCDLPAEEQGYNVVTVHLTRPFDRGAMQRNFYATSSCGVCGKASLDQVEVRCEIVAGSPPIPRSVVVSLPERLRAAQRIFDQTGGLHAAALFDGSGELMALREDVGRHNAVDKLAGMAVLAQQVPLKDRVLLVSGRVSFELVQKAAVAGVPVLCAISAPSSLAVEAAERLGVTVVGFLRGESFNVYSHPERIALDT
ncbi:MAG TPA: formate dehydrogenase accessory sulfurtransferase FdhD [Actinobacteria bacterium]|nr:formate dehydrogenase accessory sulfurtransferase FdhD [Actinomycetota bacterium]